MLTATCSSRSLSGVLNIYWAIVVTFPAFIYYIVIIITCVITTGPNMLAKSQLTDILKVIYGTSRLLRKWL